MPGSRSPREFVAAVVRDLPRSGIRDFFDIVSQMEDVISLGVGEPDFATPWSIRELAIYALEKGLTSYTSNLGLSKLRQAVSAYVERVYGVRYRPEDEILITVGVSEAMDLALRAVINPGDEVVVHEPCYVSYVPLVVLAGGKPRVVATRREERFHLRAADLARAVTPRAKALVLNFPNNPTGAVLAQGELEEIAEVVRRHDLLVIADEIYSELTYEGRPSSLAALPGMRERTVFLHGVSKAWAMTGFRVGYACGCAPLIEAMMKIHQYSMLCAPRTSQEAAVAALRQGQDATREMVAEYRLRRNLITEGLRRIGLPCPKPEGAFYVFPSVAHLGHSSREFCLQLLEQEKVAAVPGTAFGPSGEGYIRCSYAASREDLEEAIQRMGRFVQRLQGRTPERVAAAGKREPTA